MESEAHFGSSKIKLLNKFTIQKRDKIEDSRDKLIDNTTKTKWWRRMAEIFQTNQFSLNADWLNQASGQNIVGDAIKLRVKRRLTTETRMCLREISDRI